MSNLMSRSPCLLVCLYRGKLQGQISEVNVHNFISAQVPMLKKKILLFPDFKDLSYLLSKMLAFNSTITFVFDEIKTELLKQNC